MTEGRLHLAVAGGLCAALLVSAAGARLPVHEGLASDAGMATSDMHPAAPVLDWVAALRLAVARHPSVRAAQASLDQQASLVTVARAGYLPRVYSEVSTGNQGEFGTGQVMTVGVTQTLLDFGKTSSAVARERAGERAQAAALLQSMDDVVGETATALIEVHRFEALLDATRRQMTDLDRVREITELRAEAGAATRSDPLQARSRIEAVQARLMATQAQLLQWRSQLQMYLGANGGAEVGPPPEHLLAGAPGGVDIDALPAVRVAREQLAAAEASMRGARARRWPTVALEANANQRLGGAGDRYEAIYGRSRYGTAFVTVRSDLYQGGATSAEVRASASALEAADAQLALERMLAEDELRRRAEDIAGLERRLSVLEARVSSITQTRQLYWDQYLSLGTRNALDLLNAEQEIAASIEDLENARHDLWRAQVGYLVASGRVREVFGIGIGDGAAAHGVGMR